MEQTVYLGSSTTDVVVYTQAINSSGSHVALVVNTSTSKLVFADGTVSSATPTVSSLGTGKAKVTFASIANSSLSAGDTVAVRLNGTADGVAFSEYMIPVFVATASSGGGGGSSLTQADIRTAVDLLVQTSIHSLATSRPLASSTREPNRLRTTSITLLIRIFFIYCRLCCER